jgi:hypothetical protein
MSTSAQPLGTRPPVLNHMDVILNIIIWSTTLSQLSHRGERYTHHMGTPNHWGTTQLSRGERCPNHWGTTQLSHRGERCPITWVCPTLGSLSGRLNSVSEENVSWRMSHDAAIINTPSQLRRRSPPGQVSHGSTRTSSWQAVW